MASATDPVCGMTIDPARAAGSMSYEGTVYYFCHRHCLEKFRGDPRRFLSGSAQLDVMPPDQTRQDADLYVCPMDPDVASARPGACPKCGMALEPWGAATDDAADAEQIDLTRRFWIGAALGVPLLALTMSEMLLPRQPWSPRSSAYWQFILATPVMLYSAAPLFVRAAVSLRHRSPNMFTLICLGVGAAYVYSTVAVFAPAWFPAGFRGHHGTVELYFESAVMIVVLVLLGQVLEGRARRATTSAIRQLASLAPKTARLVLPNGREDDLPLDLIQVGDVVRVRPGEKVAVDGVVVQGSSTVDEALLTGEPLPAVKGPGSRVVAGSLNGTGTLLVRTERIGAETFLAQMAALVSAAQRSRPPIQRLVDRLSAALVPVVVAVSSTTFLAWGMWGGEAALAKGFIHAVAVLIIACPCALGLATPLALTVGIGRGARAGILVKNAEALEKLCRADVLVIDKTGTLTEGKPRVQEALPVHDGLSPAELLRLAASLEQASEHPLAAAFIAEAQRRNLVLATVEDFEALPGQGVRGRIGGAAYLFGSARLLHEHGIPVSAAAPVFERLRNEGATAIGLARDVTLLGVVSVGDAPRAEAREAMARLRKMGIRILMLTGDSRTTAAAVAQQVGIDEVSADLLPADKQAVIHRLQAEGSSVAMVGDGINDAPALAQADVGIALGCGAELAMASAAVTIVRSDLRLLAEAWALSRATVGTIRSNLALALVYNMLALPFAAVGWIPPTWAAAAMTLSSLSVVGNSLRLPWREPQRRQTPSGEIEQKA
ncbi:MAG: heavy metal translocating P-type ATPase [Gemmataceae bacterium]|nr:heavy metal translocating P-type ATPase [Gemmataceae bacterium]